MPRSSETGFLKIVRQHVWKDSVRHVRCYLFELTFHENKQKPGQDQRW